MSRSLTVTHSMHDRTLLMLTVFGGTPQPAPRPHLCTLLDISMGRPMFLDSRLKLGSKYSSGEIAEGLVGLAACCTGA